MKKFLKIALASTLLLSVASTTVFASANKGQRIFIKMFKPKCGFNGADFAVKHSQKEWKAIMDEGKFKEEMMKICPNVKESDIKDKWVKDLFDFSYEYANDSGNVPSC